MESEICAGKLNLPQGVYDGEYLLPDKKHGKGTMIYSNGDKYVGDWSNGEKNGAGVYFFISGSKYDGEYKNDSFHGKGLWNDWIWVAVGAGMYIWANGNRYYGNWKSDKRNGTGTFTSANKSKYEGEWLDDKKEGKGIFTWPSGDKYEGEWQADRQNGKGIYTWSNGKKYEGEWKDDKKHGRGVLKSTNGEQYNGEWKEDQKCGKGVSESSNGSKYDGEWQRNMRHGQGVFVNDGDKYVGGWKDDEKHGKGVYICSDGRKYDGEFKEGNIHGTGTFSYGNGNRYEGQWKEGEKAGMGIFYFASDEKFEGKFEGNYPKEGVYKDRGGIEYYVEFEDEVNLGGRRTLGDSVFQAKVKIQSVLGQRVMLHGLDRSALNGCTGTCRTFDRSKVRWNVELEKTNQIVAVRTDNLKRVQSSQQKDEQMSAFEELLKQLEAIAREKDEAKARAQREEEAKKAELAKKLKAAAAAAAKERAEAIAKQKEAEEEKKAKAAAAASSTSKLISQDERDAIVKLLSKFELWDIREDLLNALAKYGVRRVQDMKTIDEQDVDLYFTLDKQDKKRFLKLIASVKEQASPSADSSSSVTSAASTVSSTSVMNIAEEERDAMVSLLSKFELWDIRQDLLNALAKYGVRSVQDMTSIEEEDVDLYFVLDQPDKRRFLKLIASLKENTRPVTDTTLSASMAPSIPSSGTSTTASKLSGALRGHLLDEEDCTGQYRPMAKYGKGPSPSMSCMDAIRASGKALGVPHIEQSLDEVSRVVQSRLESADVLAMIRGSSIPDETQWRPLLAAIAMYTFDFRVVCDEDEYCLDVNFYYQLNKALQRRAEPALRHCSPYLHYLMKALESLPSYTHQRGILWRGVNKDGRDLLLRNYTLNKRITWSGFSSASPTREVAEGFAGPGGVLLRIRLLKTGSRCRDIRLMSTITVEDEVLLLPNFSCLVTEEVEQTEDGAEAETRTEWRIDIRLFRTPLHHLESEWRV